MNWLIFIIPVAALALLIIISLMSVKDYDKEIEQQKENAASEPPAEKATKSKEDATEINPTTGLPMNGAFDIGGNAWGESDDIFKSSSSDSFDVFGNSIDD